MIVGMVWNFAELQSIMQLFVATLCCCISFFRTIATSVEIILFGPKSYCNCMLNFCFFVCIDTRTSKHWFTTLFTLHLHAEIYQKLHTHAITSLNCLVNHCFDVRNNVSTCYKFLISKHIWVSRTHFRGHWR